MGLKGGIQRVTLFWEQCLGRDIECPRLGGWGTPGARALPTSSQPTQSIEVKQEVGRQAGHSALGTRLRLGGGQRGLPQRGCRKFTKWNLGRERVHVLSPRKALRHLGQK